MPPNNALLTRLQLEQKTKQQSTPDRLSRLAAADVLTTLGSPINQIKNDPFAALPGPALGLISLIGELPINVIEAGIEKAAGAVGADINLPRFTRFSNLAIGNREQALQNAGTAEPKTTAENIAANVTAFLPFIGGVKTASKTADAATRLLLPLVQSRKPVGVAAEMALGFVPVEAANAAIDPSFQSAIFGDLFKSDEKIDPTGTKAILAKLNVSQSTDVAPTTDADTNPTPALPVSLADAQSKATEPKTFDFGVAPDDNTTVIQTPPSAFTDENVDNGVEPLSAAANAISFAGSIAVGGAILATGFAAMRGRHAGFRAIPTELTGARAGLESVTTKGVKAATLIANRHAPLESIIRRAAPKALVNFLADLKTTVTPSALASRTRAALMTGDLPNSAIKIPSLAIHAETIAAMKPEQIAKYSDALTAMDKLDDLNISNTNIWQSSTSSVSRVQLDTKIQDALSDPLVKKMVNEVHDMMRGIRRYLSESDMLTVKRNEFFAERRANYAPTQFDEGTPNRDLFDFVREVTGSQPVAKLTADFAKKRLGKIGPGEGLPPFLLLEERISQALHVTEQNRIRRKFFEALQGTTLGGKFIKEIKPANADTITYLKNGEPHHMLIGDGAIRTALEFNPRQVATVFNISRRILQAALTKQGNPGFVAVSWGYELTLTPLLRNKGANLGIADEFLQRVGLPTISNAGDKLGGLFSDPTFLLAPVTGSVRSGYANMMFALGKNMEISLRTDGKLASMLGPKLTKKLANVGIRAYENSFVHAADQFGTGKAVYASSKLGESLSTQMNNVAPKFFDIMKTKSIVPRQAIRFWRAYSSVLSNLSNANRIQHLAANVTPSTRETLALVRERGVRNTEERIAFEKANRQATNAAAETRRSGVDAAQVSGDPAVQKALSASTFGDIAVQSVAELTRTIRKHPMRTMTAITGTLTAMSSAQYLSFRDNPRAAHHYYNVLTPKQRSEAVYFYRAGTDEIVFQFPIDQLIRPMWGPLVEMLGTVTGIRNGIAPKDAEQQILQGHMLDMLTGAPIDEKTSESIRQSFTGALLENVPGVPPLTNTALAFAGKRLNVGRLNSSGPVISDITTSKLNPDRFGRTADSVFSAETEAVFQSLVGTAILPMIQSVDVFNRTFVNTDDLEQAVNNSLDTVLASQVDRFRITPTLFGLKKRILTGDIGATLFKNKEDGVANITSRFSNQFGNTGRNVVEQPPSGIQAPDASNTALGLVLNQTQNVNSNIIPNVNLRLKRLFQELDDLRRNPDFANNPRTLRDLENRIVLQIQTTRMNGVEALQDIEAAMTKQLQDVGFKGVFRFDNFDADLADELIKIPLKP